MDLHGTIRELAPRVLRYAIARTGDPSHSELGEWLPYDPESRPTQLLGARCEMVDAPLEEERRFWDDLLGLPLREPAAAP